MPIELAGGCLAFRLQEGKPQPHAGVNVWRHVGRERGAEAISLTVLEIATDHDVAWRNASGDEVLFVVSGSGELILDGEHGRLDPDSGVFVRPNRPVAISNTGDAPLLLGSSRCPDPGPKIDFEARWEHPVSAKTTAALVRFDDQPTEKAGDGRWFRVLVDGKAGCEQVTQFVGFIPPGRSPQHFHEYEEVICILEGEARFWSGDSSTLVGPGWGLYLPRRQPHCLENTGTEPLKLHGLFYPAGSPAVRYRPDGQGAPGGL